MDPSYSDLTCDITAQAGGGSQTQGADPSVGGGQGRLRYTVKPGDTLSNIALQFYGSASEYMRIFNANRDKLQDPNKIRIGEELTIPSQNA